MFGSLQPGANRVEFRVGVTEFEFHSARNYLYFRTRNVLIANDNNSPAVHEGPDRKILITYMAYTAKTQNISHHISAMAVSQINISPGVANEIP